jgi:hypothetical protein
LLKIDFLGDQWVKKHWKFWDPFHFPQDPFHGLRIHFLLQGICFHDGSWVDIGGSGYGPDLRILHVGVADLVTQLSNEKINFADFYANLGTLLVISCCCYIRRVSFSMLFQAYLVGLIGFRFSYISLGAFLRPLLIAFVLLFRADLKFFIENSVS